MTQRGEEPGSRGHAHGCRARIRGSWLALERAEPAAPEVRLHKLAVMLVSCSQRASDAGARRSFGSYGAMKPRGAVMR